MGRAELDYRAILRSLTVAPGRRFARTDTARQLAGTVAVGGAVDLVVLEEDPSADLRAFARPWLLIRAGKVVYQLR